MATMATQTFEPAHSMPWYRSLWGVLVAALLLPPVGLILMWLRPLKGGALRILGGVIGRLALSGLLVILTLVYLVKLGVLHMEMAGNGIRPIFSLRDPDADQAALERNRAQQAATAPPASEAPAEPAATAATTPVEAASAPAEKAAAPAARAYWTDFRGPMRDGIYTEMAVRASWPADGLKPLWRQPVGGGYASFVTDGSHAFTIEQRRGNEVVAAYDIRTGRELWSASWAAFFEESMGGDGPRATPTWHNGKLYALGATGEFRCIDAATGKVLWSKNILRENGASNITWGMANAPLVVDDKVIVTPGGSGGRSVVAYNKDTGERIWDALDDHAAYTSPVILKVHGERQLVVVTADRMAGLRVETGELLWDFPWTTMYEINSAQPIAVDGQHLFISAGYDHGAALVRIDKNGDRFSATPVWENRNMKNRFNSSVLHDGHIYGFDESIFACIDARSGERAWKGGRYGYGQALLVNAGAEGDARIIVLTETGDLVLLRSNPAQLEELARFKAIDGKTWNHMAIEGGILLVRNVREMAAFDLRP